MSEPAKDQPTMTEILRQIREQYAADESKDQAFCTDQDGQVREVIKKLREKSLD